MSWFVGVVVCYLVPTRLAWEPVTARLRRVSDTGAGKFMTQARLDLLPRKARGSQKPRGKRWASCVSPSYSSDQLRPTFPLLFLLRQRQGRNLLRILRVKDKHPVVITDH